MRGKYRPLSGLTGWMVYGLIIALMGLKAYYIREWKKLFMVCSLPYIFVLFFYKCFPESIRWQRLHGKTDKAMETFRKMASVNNNKIPAGVELSSAREEESHGVKKKLMSLFDSKKLAIYSLAQGYTWFALGLVYYALSFATSDIGGDLYVNFILLGLVEVPACIVTVYIFEKFGRKPSVIISNLLSTICIAVIAFLINNEDARITRIVMAVLGKFFKSISFSGIYVWSLEIYPTSVRAVGMGYLQVLTRIGAALSPWVAKSLRNIHPSVPFIVMAVVALISSIVCLVLPETKGKPTIEVKSDLEHYNTTDGSDTKTLVDNA